MQSVYGLVDPRNEQVRYIGIAKDVHRRYAQHLIYPHKNDIKDRWLLELKEAGLIPGLLVLESGIEDTSISKREKHWIHHYLAKGVELTNCTYTRKSFLVASKGTKEKHVIITHGKLKVFPVEDGYQIFWCPFAPIHYNDRIPYNGRIYPQKQGAYRKLQQLKASDDTQPRKAVEERG